LVEAYPQDTPGKEDLRVIPVQRHAQRSLFENAGFTCKRPVGKNHCVMRKTAPPSYHEDGGSWRPWRR